MSIEKKFPYNTEMVLYNALNSLQMWGELLKESDKTHLSKMVERLEEWIRKRDRCHEDVSDIAML